MGRDPGREAHLPTLWVAMTHSTSVVLMRTRSLVSFSKAFRLSRQPAGQRDRQVSSRLRHQPTQKSMGALMSGSRAPGLRCLRAWGGRVGNRVLQSHCWGLWVPERLTPGTLSPHLPPPDFCACLLLVPPFLVLPRVQKTPFIWRDRKSSSHLVTSCCVPLKGLHRGTPDRAPRNPAFLWGTPGLIVLLAETPFLLLRRLLPSRGQSHED